MLTSKKSKLAGVAAVGTLLLGGGGAAFAGTAASTPAGGTVHVFVNVDVKSQTIDPIVITGAIGDYGKAVSIDKSGKVDANGNYVRVVLTKGTFKINATALNAKANKTKGIVNVTTCSFSLLATGNVSLFDGTGLYKGIRGTTKLTETFGLVGPRKANGTCNQNGAPLSLGGAVTGIGKVWFG